MVDPVLSKPPWFFLSCAPWELEGVREVIVDACTSRAKMMIPTACIPGPRGSRTAASGITCCGLARAARATVIAPQAVFDRTQRDAGSAAGRLTGRTPRWWYWWCDWRNDRWGRRRGNGLRRRLILIPVFLLLFLLVRGDARGPRVVLTLPAMTASILALGGFQAPRADDNSHSGQDGTQRATSRLGHAEDSDHVIESLGVHEASLTHARKGRTPGVQCPDLPYVKGDMEKVAADSCRPGNDVIGHPWSALPTPIIRFQSTQGARSTLFR